MQVTVDDTVDLVKQNDVEIRNNEKQKEPKLPKTNGNGKVNGKHETKSEFNHKTSKKREMNDSSDNLTLNHTTKKTKRKLCNNNEEWKE